MNYPREMPATTKLWDEILQRHWTFLDSEDGMQKLEERKKLEACLKDFLSIVPHDRKFFLPETSYVLKKSIEEMDYFSANKAMNGFESISQYANNLFTKPWRKEFKIIKMYSGFYQHEINSNLIDAEKLFKAMGYRQLENQILVLDGPICPDQVTNVSRDGMAAFVECKIMKNILMSLHELGVKCSWSDVYNFRENNIGNQSTAIKQIAYAFQERKYKKEKQMSQENCYGPLQHSMQLHQQFNQPQNCTTCCNTNDRFNCHQVMQPQLNNGMHNGDMSYCQMHGINNVPLMPQTHHQELQKHNMMTCNIYPKTQHYPQTSNTYNYAPLPVNQGYTQMTHSKSLEHYSEPTNNILPHMTRHSFDHYDCVDGSGYQNYNYNSYNQQTFNVSGNRHPLPYHISNQISNNQFMYGHCQPQAQQSQQQAAILPQINNGLQHNYHVNSGGGPKMMVPLTEQPVYNDYNCMENNKSMSTNTTGGNIVHHHHPNIDGINNSCILHPHGGNSVSGNLMTNQSEQQYNASNNEFLDLYNKNTFDNLTIDDQNVQLQHQQQQQMNHRNKRNSHQDKYINRNSQAILEQSQKIYDNNGRQLKNTSIMRGGNELTDMHSLSYSGGSRDICGGTFSSSNDSTTSTATSQNKNHDGVGSFESWNFVFQNLEKNGYTKDLGERGDLMVQGLDLDSIKMNENKRKSREIGQQTTTTTNQPQSTMMSTPILTTTSSAMATTIRTKENDITGSRLSKNLDSNKIDTNAISKKVTNNKTPTTTTKSNGHVNRDFEGIGNVVGNRDNFNNKMTPKINKSTNKKSSTDKSKSKEWSCDSCTFLNQNSKQICEVCARSKDYMLLSKT